MLEALDKVSWVKTSYDALCLPVISPRVEIVQKQGNDYYLSRFFWEGGVGLLLRSKVQARGNEFTLIVSERYELLRSAASAAEVELIIAEKIVPKPELLKYRRQ